MRTSSQFASTASCIAAAALLAACTTRTVELYPVAAAPATTVVPAATVVPVTPIAAIEFGRVTNIEYFPGGTAASRINVPGAIVGSVAGTTVVAGTAVMGGPAGTPTGIAVINAYRVTIHTDSGVFRTYDVPATGDLRVGDRVRVDSGVIYRS